MKMLKTAAATLAAFTLIGSAIAGPVQVDEDLPDYKVVPGVSGTLNSVGSDTLNNLMQMWNDEFVKLYPNVTIQVEGKGSSTAPPALIEGASQLGPMSRAMKSSEVDQFEAAYKYKPTAIATSIDALAVFVPKDNPIKGMTLQQVDSVFSKTYKRGGQDITTWGQLDLTGDYAKLPISIYGRNSSSGTYGFFKEHVLKKGDYRDTVKEQPGSSGVVGGLAGEKGGIGYSGIGYATADVRAVPLSEDGDEYYEATMENCASGDYPLARFLWIYVNKKPGKPLDKLQLEFMTFVLSKQGQEIVVKDGYFPLPAEVAAEYLEKLSK